MRPNYRRVDAAARRAAPGDTAASPQEQLARLPSAGDASTSPSTGESSRKKGIRGNLRLRMSVAEECYNLRCTLHTL
jgi:hypothetical protein